MAQPTSRITSHSLPILDLRSAQYLYVDPGAVNTELKKLIYHGDAYSVTIIENELYFKYSSQPPSFFSRKQMHYLGDSFMNRLFVTVIIIISIIW